jgi:hypothetical protein
MRLKLSTTDKNFLINRYKEDGKSVAEIVAEWNLADGGERLLADTVRKLLRATDDPEEKMWKELESGCWYDSDNFKQLLEMKFRSTTHANQTFAPFKSYTLSYDGVRIRSLDPERIPQIDQETLSQMTWDESRNPESSSNSGLEFRKVFERNGGVITDYRNLVSSHSKSILDRDIPGWVPGTTGPWSQVATLLRTPLPVPGKKKEHVENSFVQLATAKTAFQSEFNHCNGAKSGSDCSTLESVSGYRLNPSLDDLLALAEIDERNGRKRKRKAAQKNISMFKNILSITEMLYENVSTKLRKRGRDENAESGSLSHTAKAPRISNARSRPHKHGSRVYDVSNQLSSKWISFLFNLPPTCEIQLFHMDDELPGVSGIWGLVPNQYIVVWLNSYRMNLIISKLRIIYRRVIADAGGRRMSEIAYWNMVVICYLESVGFGDGGKYQVTPVRIPLEVGKIFLFDSFWIHSGMGREAWEEESLRVHLYLPQVHKRGGEEVQQHTIDPWQTGCENHLLYPGLHFIGQTYRLYELPARTQDVPQ